MDKKMIFIDVDTQRDFMDESGKLYIKGAEDIRQNIHKLTELAIVKGISILATMDAHKEGDPEFETYGEHCVIGTPGQDKIEESMGLSNQIVFDKKGTDIFDTSLGDPLFKAMLEDINPDIAVIYGVATDICVSEVINGMLSMEKNFEIRLVEDATVGLDEEKSKLVKEKLIKWNGSLIKTEELINGLS